MKAGGEGPGVWDGWGVRRGAVAAHVDHVDRPLGRPSRGVSCARVRHHLRVQVSRRDPHLWQPGRRPCRARMVHLHRSRIGCGLR